MSEEIDIDKVIENYEKDLQLADKYGCFITKTRLADELLRVCKNLKEKLKSKEKQIKLMQQCDLAKELHKLQKENDNLKENNLSYQEELAKAWKENENINWYYEDKIRNKIKELEELFDKNEKEIIIQYQNQFIVDVVGILEELLGDDE